MSPVTAVGRVLHRARRGLYGGKRVLTGNKVSDDGGNRSRRTWKPNTQSKLLFSAALGASVRLTVTASALRTIDRAGGLDAYLLATPPGRLDSDAGEELRARVVAALRARREAGQVAAPGPAAEGA